ncbi:outer membrane receptor for ferric coprogen and ferric-rhodotorulic acid [Azospirillum lipoferum]|uniref:TonB-dependent siderophore receptor n=2 Tax=Azospirillum lipoferum TaxID=193 RepID=A0A5A9G2W0_AZOLI|nr:TonB-dependent siderophore receptor [Azospirillum sp. NL1]KAA0588943.1 TonB-dependent siderophore receptor [Azospirillum lipoferum]MCP1615178.1 outer membrane receptor for ferric coprogen and ferric-rhodotorulic acid [Azospirillum lipoferum]MDW5537029.1 TonB-dependent siderophore receptor [Azospirillum sp. NL1]
MKTIGQPGRHGGKHRGRVRLLGSVAAAALLLPAVALAQNAAQNAARNAEQKAGGASSETMTLPTIDVGADRQRDANPPTSVGSKLPLAPREVPQTVTTVPRERIEEQKLITLEDAMKQTPGVTVEPIDGNRLQFYSRGFEMTNLQFDGVPTTLDSRIFASPDLAMYERVEVLKGPAGLLNGMGGPGGAINLVRKTPKKTLEGYGELTAGSYANYRGEGDITGPLNQSGSLRGRFVGAYQDRNAFQDWTEQRRGLAYGSIAADLTPDTTLTAGAWYQRMSYQGAWNLPGYASVVNGQPQLRLLDVDRSTSLGEKWNEDVFTTKGGFADLEHRFGNGWAVKLATHYIDNQMDRKMAYAYSPVTPGVNRTTLFAQKLRYDQDQIGADLSASGNFGLFGQTHEAVVGANYERWTFRHRAANPVGSWSVTQNIFSPDASAPEPAWRDWQRDTRTTTDSWGTYGVLRLKLADPLKLIVGGRMNWWQTKVDADRLAGTAESSASVRGKVTPYAGLVYDVNSTYALYTSVTQMYQPQSFVDASGKVLEPLKGRQYEAGIKADYFGGRLHATASVFHIEEENRPQSDPRFPNQSIYISSGKAQSRGFELDVSGEILPGWDAYAGYTFTRAKSLDSSANSGSAFTAIAPMHQIKLWTNYRLPESIDDRLSVGGGVTAQTSMYNEFPSLNYARLTQGGYATVDARIGYDLTEKVTAAVNVKNLFDRTYYQRINNVQSGNIYGEPRTVLLTLRAKL